jgi:hypothetical protein
MSFAVPPSGQLAGPGVGASAQPRDIFFVHPEASQWLMSLPFIDAGNTSLPPSGSTAQGGAGNPSGSPFTWILWAGQLMGRATSGGAAGTSTGLFLNSIIGLSSGTNTASSTNVNTDVLTAAEIVRRIGASGSIVITGDDGTGAVFTQLVSFSAVNVNTGVITTLATIKGCYAGCTIGANEGTALGYSGFGAYNGTAASAANNTGYISPFVYILADQDGVELADEHRAYRQPATSHRPYGGGGVLNTGMLVNYPSTQSSGNTLLQQLYQAIVKASVPNVIFQSSYTG